MDAISNINERKQVAIDDCKKMISWYDRKKRISRRLFYLFQVSAIVLSALTPIFILWSELPKAIQALPAALVSISVGLSAIFKWRENWAIRAYTSEALKRELMKYQARASKKYNETLSEQEVLDTFVETIDTLTMSEVSEWKDMQFQATKGQKSLTQ